MVVTFHAKNATRTAHSHTEHLRIQGIVNTAFAEEHAGRYVNVHQLANILKKVDGQEPLPTDVQWCMKVGSKENEAHLTKGELAITLNKYAKYKREHPTLVDLLNKYDSDNNNELDDEEMEALLKEAVGTKSLEGGGGHFHGNWKDAVWKVRFNYSKFAEGANSKKVKGLCPSTLAKAISQWDDEEHVSEDVLAGFLPSFDLPDASKKWADMFSCCSKR